MRICKDHWAMMRASIDEHGLSGLVAKDAMTAVDNAVAELQGDPDPKNERFDPLMSMHWHFTNYAIFCGGLAMMNHNPNDPDGHYCPLCELAAHYDDFKPQAEINKVSDQMLAWCRAEGLVSLPS